MTALQKNRSVRREAMCEHFSVHEHYQQLLVAIEQMIELAEGAIDQEAKDRFSMLLVIVDKLRKVVARYLPPTAITQTQQSTKGSAQSALQRAVSQLAQKRITLERTQPTIEPMSSQAGQRPDASTS